MDDNMASQQNTNVDTARPKGGSHRKSLRLLTDLSKKAFTVFMLSLSFSTSALVSSGVSALKIGQLLAPMVASQMSRSNRIFARLMGSEGSREVPWWGVHTGVGVVDVRITTVARE